MDFLQKGWECPKCGAVMSPTTSVCVNCRGFDDPFNINTNTETSISTNFTLATDSKDYPPYLDRPKGFDFQKEEGGD